MTKQAEVTRLLAAVRRRQRQAVESRVGGLGLSSQQFWALEALHARGPCALGDVLATLTMDRPTASRVLAALQARDLVGAESDPADRRRRCLTLTARGKRLASECVVIAKQIRKAIVLGFSQAELGTLGAHLKRMVANLDRLDRISPPAPAGGKGLATVRAGVAWQGRA